MVVVARCSYCGSTLCAHIIKRKVEQQRRDEVHAPARPDAADGR
jgi:hypothetical protein